MLPRLVQREDAQAFTPEQWVDKLIAAADAGQPNGLIFPDFPSAQVQRQFVGSDFGHAMMEALNFYQFTQEHMQTPAYKKCRARSYLDFGTGWGRFPRLFLRDFQRSEIFGVDIDADIIAFCAQAKLPGAYLLIKDTLPLARQSARLVTAYSVFTHLPPRLFNHWLAQLNQVMAPGALLALTVEPPRFLDFIDAIDDAPDSAWHGALAAHKPDLPRHRRDLADLGIAFLPTGGGGVRTPDVYGDTVVTEKFLSDAVKPFGKVIAYVDDPARFWQAAAIVQKS